MFKIRNCITVGICLPLMGVTLFPIYLIKFILKLLKNLSIIISWNLTILILLLNQITDYYGTLITRLRN